MLNLGLIGTGAITRQMLDAAATVPDIRFAAVASRSLSRAEAVAADHHITASFGSYEELLASPDINAVYIATPNSLHVPQTLSALRAGKHVICEKPLSTTRTQAQQVFQEAKSASLFLFEAITPPYLPNLRQIRNWLPRIGDIRQVELIYTQRSSRYNAYLRGETPNVFNPDFQGGALNDLGVYAIHIALSLFGAPQQVSYYPLPGRNGIDLSGKLSLTYPGFSCDIFCAKNCDRGARGLIRGAKGVIRMDGPLNELPRCTLSAGGETLSMAAPEEISRLRYELVAFRDAIQRGDTALMDQMAEQSILAAGILEQAHL